jgi:aminoglycoside 6'-N-acetyltransferase I
VPVEVKLLGAQDEPVLDKVAADLFDDPIVPASLRHVLADPRSHLAVAVEDGLVIGFVSAVRYDHPDKPRPELWINEVGVASTHARRGVGRAMLDAVLARGRALGCATAWVLTDRDNTAALALYRACGGEAPSDQVMIEFRLDGARDAD